MAFQKKKAGRRSTRIRALSPQSTARYGVGDEYHLHIPEDGCLLSPSVDVPAE